MGGGRGWWERGRGVRQKPRHWDEDAGITHSMRTKEGADDYRYFPEPDLVPVAPDSSMRERVRAGMPELPAAWRAPLASEGGVGEHEAPVLLRLPRPAKVAPAAGGWRGLRAPQDVADQGA